MYEHDHHSHDRSAGRVLSHAVVITLIFAVVEAAGGVWAGSLALISDAGHMITDSSGLLLAWIATVIARRPADADHTWGHGRAEVIAALGSSLLMLGIVGGIVVSAIGRLRQPIPVQGGAVMLVAALGLAVNIAVWRTLARGHQNLNIRGAVLHVLGDMLGSIGALTAGFIVWLTGWTPIDPLLSLAICALILYSCYGLLRDALHVVMEGVPRHLNLKQIGSVMSQVPGVCSVHDLHVWRVDSDRVALIAHVVLRDLRDWLPILEALRRTLRERFGIEHVTLQPEPLEQAASPQVKSPSFLNQGHS